MPRVGTLRTPVGTEIRNIAVFANVNALGFRQAPPPPVPIHQRRDQRVEARREGGGGRQLHGCAESCIVRPTKMPLPDPATRNPECARRTRAPPRESGADLRGSVDAIVVCHASEKTSKFVNNMLERLLFVLCRGAKTARCCSHLGCPAPAIH